MSCRDTFGLIRQPILPPLSKNGLTTANSATALEKRLDRSIRYEYDEFDRVAKIDAGIFDSYYRTFFCRELYVFRRVENTCTHAVSKSDFKIHITKANRMRMAWADEILVIVEYKKTKP